jgi:hypothetical protein
MRVKVACVQMAPVLGRPAESMTAASRLLEPYTADSGGFLVHARSLQPLASPNQPHVQHGLSKLSLVGLGSLGTQTLTSIRCWRRQLVGRLV